METTKGCTVDRGQLWELQINDAATRVLAPLANDGAEFVLGDVDFTAGSVAIGYRLGDCAACSIAPEDLTAILAEGLERAVGVPVSVRMTELPPAT